MCFAVMDVVAVVGYCGITRRRLSSVSAEEENGKFVVSALFCPSLRLSPVRVHAELLRRREIITCRLGPSVHCNVGFAIDNVRKPQTVCVSLSLHGSPRSLGWQR